MLSVLVSQENLVDMNTFPRRIFPLRQNEFCANPQKLPTFNAKVGRLQVTEKCQL